MAEQKLRLAVSTPARTELETDADFVLLRTVNGDMGVLCGHEPGAVELAYGVVRAFVAKKPVGILAVPGGFATVLDNRVTVLTSLAAPPGEIDGAIAARQRELEESKRREKQSDFEIQRAEAALRRTLVKLEISSYSILKGNEENTE